MDHSPETLISYATAITHDFVWSGGWGTVTAILTESVHGADSVSVSSNIENQVLYSCRRLMRCGANYISEDKICLLAYR